MAPQTADLWTLTRGQPEIDPHELFSAIEVQVAQDDLDYRTQLLIHDSAEALQRFLGAKRFEEWLAHSAHRAKIAAIHCSKFDEVGFPSLWKRLMDKTKPEVVRQFLQHIGGSIHGETRIEIAGSVALILTGYLGRYTEDVDVVGEIPQELREKHSFLDELEVIYGLHLGHVQSHYFPSGWQDRVSYLGRFGKLDVYLLDANDIFLGKLFSSRIKDMGDLRLLINRLDKSNLQERLKRDCTKFLSVPELSNQAFQNWRILFGEDLPC